MDMIESIKILLVIIIRIFAGIAAYWTVIRQLQRERKLIPEGYREYNTKLILSVTTFVVTCIGTSIFQACRVGWIPHCSTNDILDDIAIFNSLGLLAAWYVMHLMVTFVQRKSKEADTTIEIKKDVKEIKKDVKIVKKKISEKEKQ